MVIAKGVEASVETPLAATYANDYSSTTGSQQTVAITGVVVP
jgi:hypothetical protein